MSFVFTRAVGYSDVAKASIVDMAAVNDFYPDRLRTDPVQQYSVDNKHLPWYPWGCNNMLPNEMLGDIRRTGILEAIVDGKARFATCQGIVPVITAIDPTNGQRVIKSYVDDAEILNWLEDNDSFCLVFAWIRDYIAFRRCIARIMLSQDRTKIAMMKRDDVTQHRMGRMDKSGRINDVWFSREWCKVYSPNDERVFSKPLLNMINPFGDLKNRTEGFEFAVVNTHPGWDEDYYPVPGWMANLKWIRIIQQIPEMKNALYENAIRARFQVIIYEDFWKNRFGDEFTKGTFAERQKLRDEVYDEIEAFLVGAKNSGKAVFTDGYRDREGRMWSDIEFKEIMDQTKQGEYLPDSAAGNSEISFTMLWNNALTGGNQKNNLYSENQGGSNVREASAMQVIIHEVERHQVQKFMNLVKRYNGWDEKHKGLEFIIPATILTTLDTGASTKGVVTGGEVKTNNNGVN
ncbi:hypothetical protein ACTJIJ_19860 [Niabella sp. 22666]|uniref:hypothetical protein n=1 Tax=Niabella sp. 22666 TaxID=3453954 RepID=UPI003F86FBD5